MPCSTDIITCLRDNDIEPYTTASHLSGDIKKRPYSVFQYDLDPEEYYLHTNTEINNWWKADLQRIVYINAYKLTAKKMCHWVSEWNFSISMDDKNWIIVDSKHSYPDNEVIQFDNVYVARYLNITGSAAECDSKLLAFQRLYLYGAISLDTFTCKKTNIYWKISLITSAFLFIFVS